MPKARPLTDLFVAPLVALAVFAIGASSARAEIPDDAMSIDLRVEPAWILVGERVTLSGSTVADGRRTTVTLQIAEPDRNRLDCHVTISAESGEYSLELGPLFKAGEHTVTAVAPDGRGRATRSFRVLAPDQALDQVASDWRSTVEDAARAIDRVAGELAALPPSPPRAEAETKLAELRRELGRRGVDSDTFAGILARVSGQIRDHPGTAPAFAPLVERLGSWSRDSEQERVELNRQLLESSRRGEVCESIHAAGEGIKVASALLNLAGTAVEIASAFFRDLLAAGVQKSLPDPRHANSSGVFAAGELVKVAEPAMTGLRRRYGAVPAGVDPRDFRTAGRSQLAGTLLGLAYDLAGLLTDRLFDRFCERLEGPFQATLHVEFSNDGASDWWRYDVSIEGRLQLRYARGEPGEGLRVRGEFVGSATEFTLWENVLQTLDPQLVHGHVAWKRTILPSIPFLDFEGDYLGAMVGPGAFFVPVDGDLVDDRLTLHFREAKVDFDGLSGRVIYVILGVRTMGFPVVVEVPFPYKGAHFILTRAADARETPFTLPVRVDRGEQRTVAERTFVRPEVRGDGNVAGYELTIRVCSPGC